MGNICELQGRCSDTRSNSSLRLLALIKCTTNIVNACLGSNSILTNFRTFIRKLSGIKNCVIVALRSRNTREMISVRYCRHRLAVLVQVPRIIDFLTS